MWHPVGMVWPHNKPAIFTILIDMSMTTNRQYLTYYIDNQKKTIIFFLIYKKGKMCSEKL